MTISEMHVMFRQYAQQMGMQNVRAILPEQIDLLLNTSIIDIVNQTIKENIGITNDRVITDNSKIGQINALRTLYKVKEIEMSPTANPTSETRAFAFSASDRNTGRMTTNFPKLIEPNIIPNYMFLVDFSLNYKKVIGNLGYNGKNVVNVRGSYTVLTPEAVIAGTNDAYKNVSSTDQSVEVEVFVTSEKDYVNLTFKPVVFAETNPKLQNTTDIGDTNSKLQCITKGYESWYLGVEGINSQDSQYGGKHYVLTKTFRDGDTTYSEGVIYNPLVIHTSIRQNSYVAPTFDEDGLETNYFPVRIIDDAYLADTLNDFVLKNRLRSPIIVTYNNNTFDIYIDKFKKVTLGNGDTRYVLENNLIPYKLRMSYISKPIQVRYAEDLDGENVDCDLPEYQHIDIVKHAVDLYRIAISGSLHAAQQQEQAGKQENLRNNYRNEGTQRQ